MCLGTNGEPEPAGGAIRQRPVQFGAQVRRGGAPG